jgi:hypothetical protein
MDKRASQSLCERHGGFDYCGETVKLDFEQRQRANQLIEETGITEELAFEIIAMQDGEL